MGELDFSEEIKFMKPILPCEKTNKSLILLVIKVYFYAFVADCVYWQQPIS